MRKNHLNRYRKRRCGKWMASLTGAALISSAMFGLPSAKAAEQVKTQRIDAITDALLKSKDEVQERLRQETQRVIKEKATESLQYLKNNPEVVGKAIQESKVFLENKIKESLQAKVEEKTEQLQNQIANIIKPKQDAKQVIANVRATAYTSGYEDNGIWNDKTHIGTKVRPGIIAVDPKIIPLGSKVYVEFGNGEGFHALAEDTGGAIKGNRIDIALPDRRSVKEFGIKNVTVHVLERGTIV